MFVNDKLSRFAHQIFQFSLVLTAFILIGLSQAAGQQAGSRANLMSDEQVLDFYRQAQSRGLSEAQIEIAAMSQGFTGADITILRQRYNKIQNTRPPPRRKIE